MSQHQTQLSVSSLNELLNVSCLNVLHLLFLKRSYPGLLLFHFRSFQAILHNKIVDFHWLWTRIVGVEGEQSDHSTTSSSTAYTFYCSYIHFPTRSPFCSFVSFSNERILIQCDQREKYKQPKFQQSCPKVDMAVFILKVVSFKIAQKVGKYFGYFLKKNVLKTFQK